jgi:SEC-C motif-containing protein
MRSRYAAYALQEAEYVLTTTDPLGPQFRTDRDRWLAETEAFCRTTRFLGLRVVDSRDEGELGWVRFEAQLSQGGQDTSLQEFSRFVRRGGRWLYHGVEP